MRRSLCESPERAEARSPASNLGWRAANCERARKVSAKLDRKRLVKVLGMLGSRHDGEVLAAARQAQYMIGMAKTSWAELLGVEPGAEPEPLPQDDDKAAEAYRGKYADPDYPDMLKSLLKGRSLDAKSRKRLEGMEDQIRRGLTLGLDDKLLVRWLYHSASFKPRK